MVDSTGVCIVAVPPTYVEIVGPGRTEGISEGKPFTFECRATGSRPAANITWWKGNKEIRTNADQRHTVRMT